MANSQCFQSISTQHRVKLPMQNVSTADDYSNEQSAKWLRCEYCSAAVRRCLVLPGIVRDREAHMGDTTHFQQQLINFFRPTSTKYYMRVSRLHIVNYIFWNVCGAFAKLALQLYLTIHMHQMEEKCCRTKLHKYYNPSMTAFQPKTLQVFYSVIPQ